MTTDKFLSLQEATDKCIDATGDPYEAYVRMAWTALGYGEFTNRMVPTPTPIEKSIARIAARHVAMTILDALVETWESPLYTSPALKGALLHIQDRLQRVAGD